MLSKYTDIVSQRTEESITSIVLWEVAGRFLDQTAFG